MYILLSFEVHYKCTFSTSKRSSFSQRIVLLHSHCGKKGLAQEFPGCVSGASGCLRLQRHNWKHLFCLTIDTWRDCMTLRRMLGSAERIHLYRVIQKTLFSRRCRTSTRKIIKDRRHPNNVLFSMLRSGKLCLKDSGGDSSSELP